MVFYFSGTGNSYWLAGQIGRAFYEKTVSVADELKTHKREFVYTLREDERIFFVFPVHSWGPAVLIKRFIEKLRLKNYRKQFVYAVCTCGDNCGDTDKLLDKWLVAKGVKLTGCCCIPMPNTYILMKGFGVDSREVEKAKLEAAPERLSQIIKNIREHGSCENFYIRGKLTFWKSRVVYPLFACFGIKQKGFHYTEPCTGCGLCARVCPTGNIHMKKKRPVWGDKCVQCTACIHRCPVRAIEFKNITQKQGRYLHPSLKTSAE